jgi:DNA modification methylase
MKPFYEDALTTLYHGDCRAILPVVPDTSGSLILTDPPYGIGVDRMQLGNGHRRLYRGHHPWDTTPADVTFLLTLNAAGVIIWGGNYFALPPARGWLVWDKCTEGTGYADCELAWTNRDGVVKKFTWAWRGAHARERMEPDRYHPTQKPVALMRWCMTFFPQAHVILDPFGGSGTTAVAAKTLGRRCIMIEQDERYCRIAVERLRQAPLPLDMPAPAAATQAVLL